MSASREGRDPAVYKASHIARYLSLGRVKRRDGFQTVGVDPGGTEFRVKAVA